MKKLEGERKKLEREKEKKKLNEKEEFLFEKEVRGSCGGKNWRRKNSVLTHCYSLVVSFELLLHSVN